MNKFLIGLLAFFVVAGVSPGATKKRRAATPAKSTARLTTAKSHATVRGTRGKSKSRKPVAVAPRRSYQIAPTPERYQEIQQALAARGYFKGEVNGQWGPESVEALRQFQKDQNLEPDGKLGSLSLIAMGLGPKRMTAQAKPSSPAVVVNPNQENQPNQTKEQP